METEHLSRLTAVRLTEASYARVAGRGRGARLDYERLLAPPGAPGREAEVSIRRGRPSASPARPTKEKRAKR